MSAQRGKVHCNLYKSAFSGEVVFAVRTTEGQLYEGVAPKHYANPSDPLGVQPIGGTVDVRVIGNGGGEARVRMPDGEAVSVPADTVDLKENG